ncbi:MAG: hypothetical protein ACI94Y_000317 [Maribacter sp.]|jgi:hypothetical protein
MAYCMSIDEENKKRPCEISDAIKREKNRISEFMQFRIFSTF